jgi:uncharacterized membrane protein YidH (DUF202 family)
MEPTNTATPNRRWHIANWPTLAWIETALKLVAITVVLATAASLFQGTNFTPPIGKTWIQIVILGILSLGLLAAIYDRLLEREIIAMIFVILNNLGHWGMTLLLLQFPKPTSTLLLFSSLMLAGDLVKLSFLFTTDYRVRELPKSILYILTGIYTSGYVVLLLIELLA